jgi:hypothetical protein
VSIRSARGDRWAPWKAIYHAQGTNAVLSPATVVSWGEPRLDVFFVMLKNHQRKMARWRSNGDGWHEEDPTDLPPTSLSAHGISRVRSATAPR